MAQQPLQLHVSISSNYFQAPSVIWIEESESPHSWPSVQLFHSEHPAGITVRLSAGRTHPSTSRFRTIASKGWNNAGFQNSHGNSSFSLQTPTLLAAVMLNPAAACKGDVKPVFRWRCSHLIKHLQALTTDHSQRGNLELWHLISAPV